MAGKGDGGTNFMKYILIIINIIILFVGLALMGLGLWGVIDRNKVAEIMGLNSFTVVVALIFVSGIVLFLLAILGFFGAIKESRLLLGIYATGLSLVVILLFVGGVLAFVFYDQLGPKLEAQVTDNMMQNLVRDYGYEDTITDAWDWAQEKLRCCGVVGNTKKAWYIYHESRWFREKKDQGSGWDPIFVPKSCCRRIDRRYISVESCQKARDGPPAIDNDVYNHNLYYDGCYTKAVKAVKDNGIILGAAAFVFTLLLIIATICAFILCRRITKEL